MKIKAKNTNSASENAIISVLFTYHETSFMANDLNHNMAHGTEELFMTLMIQQVAIVLLFFFLLFLRHTAVLRCREVWFRRGARIFRVVFLSAKTRENPKITGWLSKCVAYLDSPTRMNLSFI